MAILSRGRLTCLKAQLCSLTVNGEFQRFVYRLWRATDDGYLLDVARMEPRGRVRVVDRQGVWLADGERAQTLFKRLSAHGDPVLPAHLTDVVRDALWEAAQEAGSAAEGDVAAAGVATAGTGAPDAARSARGVAFAYGQSGGSAPA